MKKIMQTTFLEATKIVTNLDDGSDQINVRTVVKKNKSTIVVRFENLPGQPVKVLKKKRCRALFNASLD